VPLSSFDVDGTGGASRALFLNAGESTAGAPEQVAASSNVRNVRRFGDILADIADLRA
jgi:hypothetical protein